MLITCSCSAVTINTPCYRSQGSVMLVLPIMVEPALLLLVQAALKRFQLDYVDLVFCHRPDVYTPIEETVRAMNFVIDQGWAFYWGTSEWSAQQITEVWHSPSLQWLNYVSCHTVCGRYLQETRTTLHPRCWFVCTFLDLTQCICSAHKDQCHVLFSNKVKVCCCCTDVLCLYLEAATPIIPFCLVPQLQGSSNKSQQLHTVS